MKKEVVIGPNSNIDFIAKKGQAIKTGEPLMLFEQSYDEKDANLLLAKIADEYQEDIAELGKNVITSKYTGIIEDIKIYTTAPREELSESVGKIVDQYNSGIKSKERLLNKYFKDTDVEPDIILPPSDRIVTHDGKVKGVEVGNGIMIEFYIKYEDVMSVGDKYTVYSALKSIISKKVPNELAPYSEYRPDEQVQVIMSHISVFARMTSAIWLAMFGNKVLIELKRQLKEEYKL